MNSPHGTPRNAILEALDVGVLQTDVAGVVIAHNRRALEILGASVPIAGLSAEKLLRLPGPPIELRSSKPAPVLAPSHTEPTPPVSPVSPQPSSTAPSQLLSMPSQTSISPGAMASSVSSQSSPGTTNPAGWVQLSR